MKLRLIFTAVLLTAATNAISSEPQQVLVPLGGRKKLSVPGNEDVVVGSTRFVKVSDQGSYLLLFGKKAGSTSISIGSQAWQVHVLSNSEIAFFEELQSYLKSVRGLQTEIHDGKIRVVGRLLAATDWIEIASIAGKYSAELNFEAKLDEDMKAEITEVWKSRFPSEMAKHRLVWDPHPHIAVAEIGKGRVHFLRHYGVPLVEDKDALSIDLPVKVKIVIAEVSRSLNRDIGIDWPQTATAQISPKLKGPSQLDVLIKAAESTGEAQVLASPTLLARSGGEAEFLAGGEFPIRLVSKHTNEVSWKKHGIYLKFRPKADISGRMKLEVITEISLIDEGLSVDNIPALKTNRISSQFDLPKSQTIILSGLVKRLSGHSSTGIPALHRIPIIGKIFGSEKFRQEKTELVIFVTPEIAHWEAANE